MILIHTKREARDQQEKESLEEYANILIHTKREARDAGSGEKSCGLILF